jgi:hypothetical protein
LDSVHRDHNRGNNNTPIGFFVLLSIFEASSFFDLSFDRSAPHPSIQTHF